MTAPQRPQDRPRADALVRSIRTAGDTLKSIRDGLELIDALTPQQQADLKDELNRVAVYTQAALRDLASDGV